MTNRRGEIERKIMMAPFISLDAKLLDLCLGTDVPDIVLSSTLNVLSLIQSTFHYSILLSLSSSPETEQL